jgi:hypothetical protein
MYVFFPQSNSFLSISSRSSSINISELDPIFFLLDHFTTTLLLLLVPYRTFPISTLHGSHRKYRLVIKNAYLLVRYLEMDSVLSRALVSAMCLPSRCLVMAVHVTIYTVEIDGGKKLYCIIIIMIIFNRHKGHLGHAVA